MPVLTEAVQTVQTTGINWESLATIVGSFAAIAAAMLAWTEHRSSNLRSQITDAVTTMSQILEAKLETKEAVNSINIRLARLEGSVSVKTDADK
jgi:uncharacterized membrane protein YccC